jgi:hypothetical protein
MSDERTVKDGFLDTVLKQIDSGQPPEARVTYERLKGAGISGTEALHLMTAVLREVMNKMIQQSKPFDDASYSELLKKLPNL